MFLIKSLQCLKNHRLLKFRRRIDLGTGLGQQVPSSCCSTAANGGPQWVHKRQKSSSSVSDDNYDACIVGGGIVGLATAQELITRHPNIKVAVLEKENELALHQTGHNSGVIHAGIYYAPGSLKAKLCVEGVKLTYQYCDKHNIGYDKVGKLIVALNDSEVPRLDELYERGLINNVEGLEIVGPDGIKEREPYCTGVKAIFSPNTGIIDYGEMARMFGKHFKTLGGDIHTEFNVINFRIITESESSTNTGLTYPILVEGKHGKEVKCRYVITCGGLLSDRLALLSGCQPNPRIVPFRGDYLLLKPEKRHLVRGNIYPVPDPQFPFLGVHFTPRMDGNLWLGPNAVLAFKREGYKLTDFNVSDTFDAISYSGLRRLALKHLTFGMKEMYRGFVISAQVKRLQQYIPDLKPEDVTRGPSGVRAMALGPDGSLVDDFVFDIGSGDLGKRILHVRNAPSPAATSSLSIAKMVADKVEDSFSL
ncbi:L-2-hydroxyglutarate dehydrogenase, mitochondrial-like [Antedon mediterranea]|uniref:L-2-hydroxyglutarate dehydrogenase, mitochondrial-like n=1 Tax=Antedon mediterranea TaxID=105859 RepID=UPI003AF63701